LAETPTAESGRAYVQVVYRELGREGLMSLFSVSNDLPQDKALPALFDLARSLPNHLT
jgi:hypothetical protein